MLSKTLQAYFVIGLTAFLIIFLYWLNSVNYYNLLGVVVFFTYSYLLWMCIDKEEDYFTGRRLWITVFVYSLIFVILYLQMSYYYTGNTFLFSERDARTYEKMGFRLVDVPITSMMPYLAEHHWEFDDWGAPLSMALILKIIPSKLFLNLCYILINTCCALLLFDVGKILNMSRKYAYMAALAFSLASYSIFFMGAFLKEEMFVFLVILSFWMLYRYGSSLRLIYLLGGGLASFLIIFFRVPVAIFIWVAYAAWFILSDSGVLRKSLFVILCMVVAILSISLIVYSADRYANGGDVSTSYDYLHTTMFEKAVSTLSALIGPFPSIFQITTNVNITGKALYGTGVLFKLLLFFPFWKGLLLCVKSRCAELSPIYIFCILEIAGLVLSFEGLELRKAIPHVPLFILAAFWYMYQFDSDTTEEIRATPYYYWTYRGFTVSMAISLMIVLAWNTLIRTEHLEHIYIQLTPLFTT